MAEPSITDFYAFLAVHKYIYTPTGELWPAESVNGHFGKVVVPDDRGQPLRDEKGEPVTMPASNFLDRHRYVQQMTWAPGMERIICDRLTLEGGWIEHADSRVFNSYQPPPIVSGDPRRAQMWLDLGKKLYPDNFDHILNCFAHRVQHPEIKINHALVLGGPTRIGKDSLIAPLKFAVGEWNCAEATPEMICGEAFNSYVRSVLLRINEAHDLGEISRFQFYERLKIYAAAPPEMLSCHEKHTQRYYIPNIVFLLITTNHLYGMHLPEDDARHYMAWSEQTRESMEADGWGSEQWGGLWKYYADGGFGHIAAYLRVHDLRNFNPKEPPQRTKWFLDIVTTSQVQEDGEMADVIDNLGNPNIITLADIVSKADGDFRRWLEDRKNGNRITYRIVKCGYVAVRSPDRTDGRWRIKKVRQMLYARRELSSKDQVTAAYAYKQKKEAKTSSVVHPLR